MSDFTISLPEAVISEIEARIEARILERLSSKGDTGDRLLRGAEEIAAYLACPVSRIYGLRQSNEIWPVEEEGRSLVAQTSNLDRWVSEGGGKRK